MVLQRKLIDLIVTVVAPGGSTTKYENPAGALSPIFALIKAETAGTYTIDVRPTKKWLAAGQYQIRLEEVTAPNQLDEKRLAAQKKVTGAPRGEDEASNRTALTSLETALTLWREADDNFEVANTLQLIAQTYGRLSNVDKTTTSFDKAEEYSARHRGAR